MSKIEQKQTAELDSYHYHEVMDRLYVLMEMVDNVVANHPVIEQNVDFVSMVENIQEYLVQLYTEVSNEYVKEENGQ